MKTFMVQQGFKGMAQGIGFRISPDANRRERLIQPD